MADIKVYYEKILRRRKEIYSFSILLASAIRARLELKFGQDIVFYHRAKSEGLYVAINDLSLILNKLMCTHSNEHTQPQCKISTSANKRTQHIRCESMFDIIKCFRESIESYSHYFLMPNKNRLSLVDFNSSMFWNSIRLILKNFIGILTTSNRQLNEIFKKR